MTPHRVTLALTALNLMLLLTGLTHWQAAPRQDPPPLVRARAVELVDEHDKVRARLNVESDGEVVFRLFDQKGTIRVKLAAGEDGSGVLLANQATEPGIHMLAKPAGSSIRLANPDGKARVLQP
jgi:hypothetical protein